MPAEGAVGPSGSRREGAGGARCSHGVASAEGARGARGAAAALGDLWGTEGSVAGGKKDRAPPSPLPAPAHLPNFPGGAHHTQVPPSLANTPSVWGVPEMGISPKTPVGTAGLQNLPKAVLGGVQGPASQRGNPMKTPEPGGASSPRSCSTPSCASPPPPPQSRAPQNRSHSPIGDPKCGPRGGSPMGGGPGCGIPGGGRGGGCPPEPGGPGWCCPIPGGPWCTCMGGIPRGG